MPRIISLIAYPVQDAAKAKEFYTAFLGTEPYVDSPYYIGYKIGDMEIGLDPNSQTGPIAYADVEDIQSSLQAMVDAGGEVIQEATNVGGGLLIGKVKDTSGNVVGFRQESKV
jgi:predicted enzyme related to lactoylglutathione lyase